HAGMCKHVAARLLLFLAQQGVGFLKHLRDALDTHQPSVSSIADPIVTEAGAAPAPAADDADAMAFLDLGAPDPIELTRIRGLRYRVDPDHPGQSPWAQGFAPEVLPDAPIADPYLVTPGGGTVEITVLKADQAELLRGLDKGGAHLSPAWQSATTWQAAAS